MLILGIIVGVAVFVVAATGAYEYLQLG